MKIAYGRHYDDGTQKLMKENFNGKIDDKTGHWLVSDEHYIAAQMHLNTIEQRRIRTDNDVVLVNDELLQTLSGAILLSIAKSVKIINKIANDNITHDDVKMLSGVGKFPYMVHDGKIYINQDAVYEYAEQLRNRFLNIGVPINLEPDIDLDAE
jgi:hypothetical protein